MQCYTQLIPPTAVNVCASLPFTSATANNLIVARSSLLQIFSLKAVLSDVELPAADGGQPRKERVHTSKLVLVAQYELAGAVTALERVRIKSKSEGELLLVALKDAKLALLGWDPERNAISTLSIHLYERDDVVQALWDGDLSHHQSILTVDPGSRCAAFKFGMRHLALLPFRQAGYELGVDEGEAGVDSTQKNIPKDNNEVTESATKSAPTAKSSVLSLLSLDPSLIHPVDIAFMHGYRDPTLAILSSAIAPSQNLLAERRDILSLTVYTLDIEQRASTTLLSVTGLPYDLTRIIPLPAPVGGILLVGSNEIIHVDQSGKTNGLAVNDVAKQTTSFALVQQGDSNLRLEDAVIEPTGSTNGDVLLALRTGALFVLTFQVDGRSVSGLSLHAAQTEDSKPIISGAASCAANLGRGRCFFGSVEVDSVVVGYMSATGKATRRPSARAAANGDGLDDVAGDDDDFDYQDDDEEDEDDLYATAKVPAASTAASSPTTGPNDYVFRLHDTLLNLAPLRTPSLASPIGQDSERKELFASSGSSSQSHLVRMTPFVYASNIKDTALTDVDGAWPIAVKDDSVDSISHHNVLFTSKYELDGGASSVYRIGKNNSLSEIEADEFDRSGSSIDVTTFVNNTRIIQVLETQIRAFEADFSLAQIVPLFEEESLERMPKVLSATFAEPYILLLRDDARITILKADESGDLEEMELPDNIANTRWMSGCLYDDPKDELQLDPEDNEEEDPSSVLAFLLTENGGLQIYQLPNTRTPVYNAPGLSFLPPYLSSDFNLRRSGKDREELVEILVAELGDKTAKSTYLILRSNANDLVIYQPFQHKGAEGTHSLRFMKIPNTFMPKAVSEEEEEEEGMGQNRQRLQPMKVVSDLQGFSSIVMPGASSCLILKTSTNHPQVFDLQSNDLRGITGFDTPACPAGLLYISETGALSSAQLPAATDFSTGWAVERPIQIQGRIDAFSQHAASKHFVLGTSRFIDYKLPHDDLHPEWDDENITFFPQIEQGTIQLVNPETWTVDDTYQLAVGEVVMSMQAHSLEVSEATHQRRDMVVIGTVTAQGEDMPVQGKVYVFDVVNVVRDPESPGPAVSLKLIALEEFRGGVTALSPVGTEGLLLVAQGQKCMVRGLTEENNFLPAAAIDVQCFVSQLRELPRSGMFVITDAIKGVWFAGYNESPYNIKLFGRAKEDIQVMAADFMPDQDRLYIVLADTDGVLHTLQFDPQNPRSLAGQRLLPLSTFRTGTDIGHLSLLPREPPTYEALFAAQSGPDAMDVDNAFALHQLLATGLDGSVSLVTPLSSRSYSTLTALQTYMLQTLQHRLGLNPRAWRGAEADRTIGGCLPIDGNLLKQWQDLGSWKRVEALRKTGLDQDWELRMVLEGIGVRGLGYL